MAEGQPRLKFGVNFRRNDVTTYSPGLGTIGESFGEDLANFFAGNSANYVQNFSVRPTHPIAVYAWDFMRKTNGRSGPTCG